MTARRTALAVSLALALSQGAAMAQALGEPGPRQGVEIPARPASLDFTTTEGWRASRLAGVPIRDGDGKKVGEVRDVLLDRLGQARTLVVSTGGLLGVGSRQVLLPFADVTWSVRPLDSAMAGPVPGDAEPTEGVLSMTREQFDAAPEASR